MLENYEYGIDYGSYPKDLIEEMYNKRFIGIPVSFYLLDLRKTNTYCYQNSALLSYILPNSVQVSGNCPKIIGNDKTHYWVECNDKVLDPTMGLVWEKEKYYEYCQINSEEVIIHSKEEVKDYLIEYLEHTENLPEMYMAIIEDIKSNLDKIVYKKYLEEHIERFSIEKKLESQNYDESLFQEYLQGLKDLYKHIDDFIYEAKKEESNRNK